MSNVDLTEQVIQRLAALEAAQATTAFALIEWTRILARLQAEVAMLRAQVPGV